MHYISTVNVQKRLTQLHLLSLLHTNALVESYRNLNREIASVNKAVLIIEVVKTQH